MARTAQGAITIMDVADGAIPISLVLTNHSHAFAADATGLIPTEERTAFTCTVFAYAGSTRCTYAASGINTYNVVKVDNIAGWVSSMSTTGQAIVTLTTVPTGVVNKTGRITLTVAITNALGIVSTVDTVISLAKIVEGTAGQVIRLTPNRQIFKYDEAGVTANGPITIGITALGNIGTLSAQYAMDGGAWTALAVGAGANQALSMDIDGVGGNDNIVINAANFGTANNFAVRVTGATGGQDAVNIIRIQDGSTGPSSLFVQISSSVGGAAFKNNTGTSKVLSVVVYDMANGSTLTPLTYQWKKNGVNTVTTASCTVAASDITDNGSELYTCEITVA